MSVAWNRETVSLVVLPDETLLPAIAPIIEEWTKEGLIDRFFLVLPSQVISREFEPPVINTIAWIKEDGEFQARDLDAFEQLAQNEFKIVRLVSLQILQKDSKVEKSQVETLERIADAVQKSLPMTNSRANESEQVTRFLKLNLVVAPTEAHAANHAAAFEGLWDMHIIASPEDRSTPWTADAMVRNDQRFLRFAMMHLASTAGLWNGINVSPFEIVSRERARMGAKWLSRVFVNAILTDGLARRVSANALHEISNAAKDVFDARIAIKIPGTEVIPPDEVDRYVSWMVDQVFVLDNYVLAFNEPAEMEHPGKLKLLEWEQIKHFFLFSWDKLKVIPWWIYVWVRRLIGRGLTQTFQTEEGLAQVGISQKDPMDLRDQRLVEKLMQVIERSKAASDAMATKETKRVQRPNARLWTDLRRIVFGMLDGSDLNEFGIKENDGRVPIFANTSEVISDPADTFALPSEIHKAANAQSLNWVNVNQVPWVQQQLTDLITSLESKHSGLEKELDRIDSELSRLQTSKGGQHE